MIQRNVAPEHQAPVIRLEDLAHATQVLKVNCSNTARTRGLAALTLTQFECLVGADVEKLPRKEPVQFAIPIRDQLVASLLLRRQHVTMRCLRQLVILLQLQSLVQVAERLLFRHQLDVVTLSVSYQVAYLVRRKRAAHWTN